MSKTIPGFWVGIGIGIAAGALLTWVFLRHNGHDEPRKPEENEPAHEPESRLVRINELTNIRLDRESQERCGLKLGALEITSLQPEVKAFGQVVDPAPLVVFVTDAAAARAALDASGKELERLKVLAQNQNASPRALEIATSQVERDQISIDAIQLKLTAAWGKALSSRNDLGDLAAALARGEEALVRIDLPMGESHGDLPAAARVAPISSPNRPVEVEIVAPAAAVDPQTQGQGFLTLAKGASLTPGTAVTAWLSLPGEKRVGVIVPRCAIVRHEGEAFVYLQSGEDLFLKQRIELNRPVDGGWFVEENLKPGSKIVLVGAEQLLSDELKAQGGGEEE